MSEAEHSVETELLHDDTVPELHLHEDNAADHDVDISTQEEGGEEEVRGNCPFPTGFA